MRVIKRIILVFLVALASFLAYVALQPPEYTISRELAINAPAEKIFPYINSSRRSFDWMPWAESDPAARFTHSGPEEGVGSASSWNSTGSLGVGRAEIVESVPNQRVKTQLTYTEPMQMSQLAELALMPSQTGTIVRWSVSGSNDFFGRAICTLIDMSGMVEKEFDKGLAKLKTMVEAR